MAELFASGRIVDGIIVMMLVELVVLVIVRKRTRRGLPTPTLLVNLAAGAALLLSLRAALADYRWQIIALWLAIALIAHVLELRLRWTAN
jgi:hypothetical protein